MTSIQDVADQINAKLDTISTSTAQTVVVGGEIRTEVQTVSGQVATLDAHVQAGFADLAAGLFAVWQTDLAQLVELQHQSQQNDTVICLLENTTELLCGITRKLTAELELSRRIAVSVERIEGIAERAEPGPAGDYDRLQELTERVEHCCPDEQPQPEPCPRACEVPSYEPYRPQGQDWKPSSRPQKKD